MLDRRTVASRRRGLSCLFGCSVLAICTASSSAAWADCTPDPTQPNMTTICSGVDADGLSVQSIGTTVRVDPDARVLAGQDAAISSSQFVTVFVNGAIDGGAKPGVLLTNGMPVAGAYDPYAGASVGGSGTIYPTGGGQITIGETGSITGSAAVHLQQRSDNMQGQVLADVDNSGQLSGTAGPALVADDGTLFYAISNAAGATIGGISGGIATLSNSGLIDGGAASAVSVHKTPFGDTRIGSVGTIRSMGTAATVIVDAFSIGNGGTIENFGQGEAIVAQDRLTLTNQAGARIASAGGVAIRSAGALQITNAGAIVGSVVSTAAAGRSSLIDTTAGTIDGDLLLGDGDDTLLAGFDFTTGRVAGVSGRVDGGGGIDTLAARIDADTTISTIALPDNFERLRVDLIDNANVALAPGANAPNGLVLAGMGTFTVLGDLTTSGPAFVTDSLTYYNAFTLYNQGMITANLADSTQTAIDINAYTLNNSGTITANGGNGVRVRGVYGPGGIVNSGTIAATGTAVDASSSTLINSGIIRSSGGTGVLAAGQTTNEGSISGAGIGLSLDGGQLENSGSITGGTTGIVAGNRAGIDNLAGGTIRGGGIAIGLGPNSGYGVTVTNAGTINGDVDLRGPSEYDFATSEFVNSGGTLNGNLFLGVGDDIYVTDLGGPSGVTGTIDAGDGFDIASFRVAADASATLAAPATFEGVDYQLSGGAALTLTAPAPQALALSLGGVGSVDLTADLMATARPVLALSGQPGEPGPPPLLSVVSRGTLNYATGPQSGFGPLAAVAAGAAAFENAGTINAATLSDAYARAIGIFGGREVLNSGTISLDGATGVDSATHLVNSGSIIQAAGGGASTGVVSVTKLDNSGIISVDGPAVSSFRGGSTITNSGTIESRTGNAIQLFGYGNGVVNLAGGVISGVGAAISSNNDTTVRNEGTIVGDVRLGSSDPYSRNTFISGGTLTGNLKFGSGYDLLLQLGDTTGVSGTIDGGDGIDTFGRSFGASATVQIGGTLPTNFERELVDAHGDGTVVTVTGPSAGSPRDLYLTGDGSIVNQANVGGAVHLTSLASFGSVGGALGAFRNEAAIGTVDGSVGSFANSGTIGSATLTGPAVNLFTDNDVAFSNSGAILNDDTGEAAAVTIQSAFGGTVSIGNKGTITGGLQADVANISSFSDAPPPDTLLTVDNSGTITSSAASGNALSAFSDTFSGNASSVALINSGTIRATGASGLGAVLFTTPTPFIDVPSSTISVSNTGTIEATGAGQRVTLEVSPNQTADYVYSSVGLLVVSDPNTTATITNGTTGTIAAPAARSTALVVSGSALNLDNAGAVTGSPGEQIAGGNGSPSYYIAGAIQSYDTDDRILNSGTITGSVDLGAGDDRIENSGTIAGDVFLRDGDDVFVQHALAKLTGTVDGGAGIDALIVDATGGGAVNGDQFVNFESFSQTGSGNVSYTGNFNYDTIALDGGTITVAAGTTLRTNGPVTITGSDAAESVANYGRIDGSVLLGGGDDSYTDGLGSSVGGTVDGGAGADTYVVALAGDRQGIGARTGFERLAVTGTGTLSLTLDQSFDNVALAATGLDLRLNGFAVGGIDGSDAAERVTLDRDVPRVALGGGDDTLRIAAATLAGSYDGGTGNDTLALTATDPVTLSGTTGGFESVTLAGGVLTVAGTLGAAGDRIGFGDGAQALTVASGGRLLGSVDLGGGADSFRLAAGGLLLGSVSGGAGTDTATLDLAQDLTITADTLRDFETLTTTGGKTLTLTSGTSSYHRIDAGGGLTVAAGSTLAAAQVQFGAGDDRFAIAGGFTGSAEGGAGIDTLLISGGSMAAPVAFGALGGFESLVQSAGFATIADAAQLGSIDLTGGRLVGLAGSTITAPRISVGGGATFGSAGSVVGNIAVAGTLSPGASPGTMTVTGNVSLGAGSTSLFELTPTVSDKLLVSGTLSIAGGATLTLTGNRPLTPGAALDLIVAGGGITGSFATVNQPATILGFLRQSSDRIQLFGQFDAAGFNPQVTATINYVNGVLTSGRASAALIAAVPSLLTSGNATNGAAFARLNPEAYASATQISIENGLTLAKTARSGAATGSREEAGAFTFAQGLGNWRPLDGDTGQGTSRARTNSYGLLGGIGFGSAQASLGGFVGYLNSHQRITVLAARTQSDGIVAGLMGHASAAGFDLSALLAYDGGKADTRRALPGQLTAASHYHLRGWVSDASIGYVLPLGAGWSLKPAAGLTYVATRRGDATEIGGGAFSLDVARRKSHATFVDGALTLQGGTTPQATVKPWITAGVRHQLNGQATLATAGFIGTGSSFSVPGVSRQATLATVGAGASIALTPRLELFGAYHGEFGSDGTGSNVNGGVRLRF